MDFPGLDALRPFVLAYARVWTHTRRLAPPGQRPVVLPNNTFFPDAFTADVDSVQRFLDRMLAHAGMKPGSMRVEYAEGDDSAGGGCGGGGCGTGSCHDGSGSGGSAEARGDESDEDGEGGAGERACAQEHADTKDGHGAHPCGDACKCRDGEASRQASKGKSGGGEGGCSCGEKAGASPKIVRLERNRGGAAPSDTGEPTWTVRVLPAEARQPVVLAAFLARIVGMVAIDEVARATPNGLGVAPGVASELASASLGLGALLLEGSHIYQKSCGGPRVGRATELGPMDLSIALALFAAVHGQSLRPARRELGLTQRECLDLAKDWVDSNRELVDGLQSDPERVVRGDVSLKETQSWLSRLFGWGKGRSQSQPEPTLEDLEAAMAAKQKAGATAKPRDEKMDEIRRLVDEAMSDVESRPDEAMSDP